MIQFDIEKLESPIGTILLITANDRVFSLDFSDCEPRMLALLEKKYGKVALVEKENASHAAQQLQHYFAGDIQALSNIKIEVKGTDFQQRVWAALQMIPAGTTCSYAQIAASIGNQKAVRAVGMANSRNPIALIVPCHRVIAADGTLSGYAGGVERKRWLLAHETMNRAKIEA